MNKPEDLPSEKEERAVAKLPSRTASAALAMAVHGATDAEIAAQLGYSSARSARIAWETAMANTIDPDTDTKTLRSLTHLRLEKALAAVSERALSSTIVTEELADPDDPESPRVKKVRENTDQLAWLSMWLRIVDKETQLHGLNAATKLEVNSPQIREFEEFVQRATKAITVHQPQEGNIFADDDDDAIEAVILDANGEPES